MGPPPARLSFPRSGLRANSSSEDAPRLLLLLLLLLLLPLPLPLPALRTAPGRWPTHGWDREGPGARGGGGWRREPEPAEAAPSRRPDLHGNRGPAPGAPYPCLLSDPIRSGPVRSGPVRASENLVRKPGSTTRTPRVPAAGPPGAIHGLPLKAQAGPQPPERDPGHVGHGRPDDRPEPRAGWRPGAARHSAAPMPPAGGGGCTGGCWSTPPGDPQHPSGSEAAAAPLPHKPRGSISHEPSARRRPRDSGTTAPVPPSSRNATPGTVAKYHPLPTTPTLRRGDAI